MESNDINPYFSRLDAAPFGLDVAAQEMIIGEQIGLLSERINREIPIVRSTPDIHVLGDADAFPKTDLLIAPNHNNITLSRRRVMGRAGLRRLKGVCAFGEDGFRTGTSIWVNLPPHNLKDDFDLAATEATLSHELLHSVGVEHCANQRCLMFYEHDQYDLYELTKRPNSFCIDHRSVLRGIARNKQYFRQRVAC